MVSYVLSWFGRLGGATLPYLERGLNDSWVSFCGGGNAGLAPSGALLMKVYYALTMLVLSNYSFLIAVNGDWLLRTLGTLFNYMFSVIILLSIECYLLSDCLGLFALVFLASGDCMFPPPAYLLTSVLLPNCNRLWFPVLLTVALVVVPLEGDWGGLPTGMSVDIVSWGFIVGTAWCLELMDGVGVGPGVRLRLTRDEVVVFIKLGWVVACECVATNPPPPIRYTSPPCCC